MPLFNNLCQCCSAYYKKLTEIQNVLSDDLWTMAQRGKVPHCSYQSCRKWSGNQILSKSFRAHRSHSFDSLLCATPSLLYPHWAVRLNVNQYINTAKNSSWILRLIGAAWLVLSCSIAYAFQNGFGVFKLFIRNGPWPVLSPECHLAHEPVQNTVHYGQGRMMGHESTTRGPSKLILVCLQSIHPLCTWKFPYHCWSTCCSLNHPHGLKEQ